MNQPENIGQRIKGILHLTPREAYDCCLTGAVILDLRRKYEIAYKSFNVENVIYSDPHSIENDYHNLPSEPLIIVADNAGLRSRKAAEWLIENGLRNVANLAGGMFEWDRDRLPILINNKERLSGSCLCMMKPMNKLKRE